MQTAEDDDKPVNTTPVAKDDRFAMTAGEPASGNVLTNDRDADGDRLTATMGSGPKIGDVVLNADGGFVYTPNEGFVGSDSFTYVVNDGSRTDTGQVALTVAKADDIGNAGGDPLVRRSGTITISQSGDQTSGRRTTPTAYSCGSTAIPAAIGSSKSARTTCCCCLTHRRASRWPRRKGG